MAIKRYLNLAKLLKQKSHFLFGPRATGKSFLITEQLKDTALIIDLLEYNLYFRLTKNPGELASIIAASNKKIIAIDEIQKIPALLNEVHRLIEKEKLTFLLTGSSARSLRNKGTNLLAGRAWEMRFFPLTSFEIENFDLTRYLKTGGLPTTWLSNKPEEELYHYVNTYLREEIQAESLVRKIPAFSRFLNLAAVTSGQMINFTSISRDSGIPVSTICEYYKILEDTFIGFMLPAWQKSVKRKAISTGKFYIFDIGVRNTLAEISSIDPKSDIFGISFEHFIALEIRAYLEYNQIHKNLSYWRSKHGYEVDFIIGDEIAIEVKTSNHIHEKHLKGLRALAEEKIIKKYLIVSFDEILRTENNIEIMHWKTFLNKLWQAKII